MRTPRNNGFENKQILVVDDDRDLRSLIAEEFRFFGCKVYESSNGRDALKVAEEEGVDAVISDIRMAGGDGVELLKSLKRKNTGCPVVLLITGFADLRVEDAFHLGAEGIFTKPFEMDEVMEKALRSLLSTENRWKVAADAGRVKGEIRRSYADLEKAISNWGSWPSAGVELFLAGAGFPVRTGDIIRLHLEFEHWTNEDCQW